MTDRDRLKQLFDNFCQQELGSKFNEDILDKFADHLLANGVFILPEDLRGTEEFSISAFIEAMQMYKEKDRYIKPPCDIGQTVYTRYGYSFKIQRIEVLEDRKIIFRCGNDGTDDYMAFYDFEIGTDVFLTKEDAEQALAERSVNNG